MVAVARYEIRPMAEADIHQVAEIERESFPSAWPATAYRRELANRLARYVVVFDRSHEPPAATPSRRRRLLDLFRRNDEPAPTTDYIVGYVGVWLLVDEAHIVAIAVRDAYRRQGLGELLLAEALELALANRQEAVTLEVRRSNVGAQTLYEKYGFLKVGVRRRYYSDNHEDAVIMSTPPIHSATYLDRLAHLRKERERRWAE